MDSANTGQYRTDAHYHAYLLRLWQESADVSWRFLLESTATGERRVFSTLEALFMYLDKVTITEDVAEDVAEDEKQSAPPQEHLPRKD